MSQDSRASGSRASDSSVSGTRTLESKRSVSKGEDLGGWNKVKPKMFELRLLEHLERIDTRMQSLEAAQQKQEQEHHDQNYHQGNAYEQLVKAVQATGTGNRHTMDDIVRNMESSQARYELKHLRGLTKVGGTSSAWQLARGQWDIFLSTCSNCVPAGSVPHIHPDGKLHFRWLLMHLVVDAACVIIVPLRLSFSPWFDDYETFWIGVELLMDVVFCIDTGLNAFTAFYREGGSVLVTEPWRVLWHYVSTWGVIDLASSLPLAPLLLATGNASDATSVIGARLLKLVKFAKFASLVRELRTSRELQKLLRSVDPSLLLLGQLLFTVMLTWHILGCLFWFISTYAAAHVSGVREAAVGAAAADMAAAAGGDAFAQVAAGRAPYIISFHWAVSVTTGLGAPVRAISEAQSLYEAFVVCLGIAMQARTRWQLLLK